MTSSAARAASERGAARCHCALCGTLLGPAVGSALMLALGPARRHFPQRADLPADDAVAVAGALRLARTRATARVAADGGSARLKRRALYPAARPRQSRHPADDASRGRRLVLRRHGLSGADAGVRVGTRPWRTRGFSILRWRPPTRPARCSARWCSRAAACCSRAARALCCWRCCGAAR